MENNEIMERYNSLIGYAQKRIRTVINDLCIADEESQNYFIRICPKRGSVVPGFIKGDFSKSGKQMFGCPVCNNRFVVDHWQLTYYSHQGSDKWDQLIEDTFVKVPLKVTAEKLYVNVCTV